MAINALSYIGVNSDKIEDWSDYSEKYLGMQKVDRGKDTLSFRMDDHYIYQYKPLPQKINYYIYLGS